MRSSTSEWLIELLATSDIDGDGWVRWRTVRDEIVRHYHISRQTRVWDVFYKMLHSGHFYRRRTLNVSFYRIKSKYRSNKEISDVPTNC